LNELNKLVNRRILCFQYTISAVVDRFAIFAHAETSYECFLQFVSSHVVLIRRNVLGCRLSYTLQLIVAISYRLGRDYDLAYMLFLEIVRLATLFSYIHCRFAIFTHTNMNFYLIGMDMIWITLHMNTNKQWLYLCLYDLT
jgi:hypothetical protein